METFFLLLAGHAFADFAVQPEPMALGKCRRFKPAPELAAGWPKWWYWLSAHALVHGGAVALITGNWWLGLAEFGIHWVIDFAKCEGWTAIHADQGLHVVTKVAWTLLA